MNKLHIAPGLTLPLETTTQAIGIVAKRRVGKSYTARRICEQLLKAGQQVVIADPKGDWWGIRSSADGKSPGFPVVILGGEHKDVPLAVDKGEMVAKLVVEERISVLLDLSEFRKREIAVFMADFLETLYRLKAKESLRTPLMTIIDEADAIAPQKPQEGEERMLGAAEDIVRRGGQRGIGCMMITQRTAVLNKNVLTQCEMLIALRTISPQDLKAMQAWIDVHGEPEERDTLMASLPSLPQGDAWFWSPGWPTADGIFKRVHVDPIETFDSGATPKSGEKRVEPKSVADIDLAALTRQMAETIAKAKADDPKELRKEIAALKKQVAAAPTKERVVERTVVDERAISRAVQGALREQQGTITNLRRALEAAMKFIVTVSAANFDVAGVDKAELERAITAATDKATAMIDQRLAARAKSIDALRLNAQRIAAQLKAALGDEDVAINVHVEKNAPFTVAPERPRPTPVARTSSSADADGSLGKGEKTLLIAIAQYPDGAEREQLTVLTGYKRSSRDTYIQRLSSRGYVEANGNGTVIATGAGIDALDNDYEPLPTGTELQAYWLNRLGGGEKRILEVLLESGGDPIARADLDERVGYQRSSRDTYLQRLSSRRLVENVGRGEVRASPTLFG